MKTAAGMVTRVLILRKTHHGPIVSTMNGKPVTLKMARFESDGWLAEWYAMTRARNLAQFKAAMRPLDMMFGNAMFADAEGNTFYVYNGAVPRRDPQFNWSEPVDGSDPRTEWQGFWRAYRPGERSARRWALFHWAVRPSSPTQRSM